ncbi:MAG: FG-GAP-like repeat-containing protein [Deltaproteobacteria bacterium]
MRAFSIVLLLLAAGTALADGLTDPPDKGGTRPEAISLPSGPGALRGMGESGRVQPATGAVRAEIPVALPPGPKPLLPDLTLRYDSRGGDGPVGVGWSLDVPCVQRRTDLGMPRYADPVAMAPTDELLWNGARLVEVAAGVYRLRDEGELVRLVAEGQGFRVDRPDGTKLYLGSTPASRVADGARTFRWLVERAVDVHGDEARYEYEADQGQRYLARVSWGRGGRDQAEVRLSWGSRPDAFPDARPGFLVTTARRLRSIESFVDDRLVRRVSLGYATGPGLSRLETVQTCGSDGSTCLPTLTLRTTEVDPSSAALVALAPPGIWLGDPDTALVDVDGDALPDVVRLTPDGASLWRNLGPQGFGPEEPLPGAPGVALSSPGVAFQDMDGAGRAALLMAPGSGGALAYFPSTASGLGAPVYGPGGSGLTPNDPAVRWLDLDGDGRVDALRGDPGGWTAWLNQGGGAFGAPLPLVAPLPWLGLTDPHLRLADMNDDGLVDLVYVQSGSVQVMLNLGFGSFGPPEPLAGAPDVQGDDTRLGLTDLTGDGLPDVYYVAPGRLSLWPNLGNGGFGPEVRVAGAPEYDPTTTSIRVADLAAHGTPELVYSNGGMGGPTLVRLDVTHGARPNLLASLDDGFGGRRLFGYRPTGELAADAAITGHPWGRFAPFALLVASNEAEDPGFGGPLERTSFDFRDPFYDAPERAFRGFGGGTEHALGDDHAAGLVTLRQWHTGDGEDEALAGRPMLEEARDESGALLQRTRFSEEAIVSATGLSGELCRVPVESERREEQWEGTDLPLVRRVRQRFDAHGHVLVREEDGRIDRPGGDPGAYVVLTRYAEDDERWILGLVAETETKTQAGARVALERRFYDGAPFAGLPLGAVLRGDLTRRSGWVEGDEQLDLERRQLDAYGNAIVSLDADGRRREVDYDPRFHEWPIEERRFPGAGAVLRFEASVDWATGEVARFVEANGAATSYGRDALGRLVSIARPDDPVGAPSELREYRLGGGPPALIVRRRPEPGGPYSVVHATVYDGLLRKAAELESAEGDRYAVAGRTLRDARGGEALVYEPFFTSGVLEIDPPDGNPRAELFRDPLGRSARRLLPAGGEERWGHAPGLSWHEDPLAVQGLAEGEKTLIDAWGRTVAVVQETPGEGEQTFGFELDPLGRLVSRTSPSGAVATARFDGLGRLVEVVDPDAGRVAWGYDGAGHPLSLQDGRGETLRWGYDGVGRRLTEADGHGHATNYVYDVPAQSGCGAASPGRLVSVTDPTGTSCFGYDARGRLASEAFELDGLTLALGFGHDAADRLTGLTYPDGSEVTFEHDGRAAVTAIPGLLTAASYDAAGEPLSRTFANGLSVTLSRDAAGRETELTAALGGRSLLETSWQLLDTGAPERATDEGGTTSYTLDRLERLSGEVGPYGSLEERIDGEGRLVGRSASPADPRLPGASAGYGSGAGPHALTSDALGGYGYDAAGERTNGRGLSLGYDAAGRLTSASGATFNATYGYGYDGERRTRDVHFGDGRETHVRTLGQYLELRDGVLWKHVFVGGERLASLPGALPAATVAGTGCGSAPGRADASALALVVLALGLKTCGSRRRG